MYRGGKPGGEEAFVKRFSAPDLGSALHFRKFLRLLAQPVVKSRHKIQAKLMYKV
jgi:hypothetical protein